MMLTKTLMPATVPDPVLCFALAYQQAMVVAVAMAMGGVTPGFALAA